MLRQSCPGFKVPKSYLVLGLGGGDSLWCLESCVELGHDDLELSDIGAASVEDAGAKVHGVVHPVASGSIQVALKSFCKGKVYSMVNIKS